MIFLGAFYEKNRFIKILKVIGITIIIFIAFITTSSFCLWIIDSHHSYLEGKNYDSIDELHCDLVNEMSLELEEDIDFWIKDLVAYFEIDDLIAFVSTYSSTKDGKIIENELFVQFAKKEEKYFLYTPKGGYGLYAVLYLTSIDDFVSAADYSRYCAYIESNDEKKSICFLYKDNEETRSIYFDNNITKEIKVINPSNNEEFYICYAYSNYDSYFSDFLEQLINYIKLK